MVIGACVLVAIALGTSPAGASQPKRVPTNVPVVEEGAGHVAAAQAERVSLLVHLQPGIDRGPIRAFTAQQGGHVRFEYNILPEVINIREFPAAAVDALKRFPGVVKVEEDEPVQLHLNKSMPRIRGLQGQIADAGLSADGSAVRICVVDTGLKTDHIMFTGRIDFDASFNFQDRTPDFEDDQGHGSHVAGTAAGRTGLSVNFSDKCEGPEPFQGVAPEATLISAKACGPDLSCLTSAVIEGIDHCADQSPSGGRADVINLSLGGGQFSGVCDTQTLAVAANNAVDAEVVVVASAGNVGFDNALSSPACGSKVIAVGAVYNDDYPSCELPDFTTDSGCKAINAIGICRETCVVNNPRADQHVCWSAASEELDVVAPGCVIFSAHISDSRNDIIAGLCGTSMSAPHVTGLAALLLDADPSLAPADVRQFIRQGAVDVGAPGFDFQTGHGRIDVINSLLLVEGEPECTIAADCDDENFCTIDECSGGICTNEPLFTENECCNPETGSVCLRPPEEPGGDFDGDGAVTLADFREVQECFGRETADFDCQLVETACDCKVDHLDVSGFVPLLEGPTVP